jgi:cytochrome c553
MFHQWYSWNCRSLTGAAIGHSSSDTRGEDMVYKKIKEALIAAGIAVVASSTAMADDGMTGASGEMLANTCAGCHGTNGISTGPATPTISGMAP